MTESEARALARFVADHDKRFVASVAEDGGEEGRFFVRLTCADDGAELPPVCSPEQYRREHIDGPPDPGATVRAAVDAWLRGS